MGEPSSVHVPVMLDEAVRWLNPRPGAVIVDGTVGGGGHASVLAERVGPAGLVIGVDRDGAAIASGQRALGGKAVRLVQADFRNLPEVLEGLELGAVEGVLLDLGVSSDQLADESRGFSFGSAGPLDLRFDPLSGEPARGLVNRLSAERLADLIHRYGEERHSRRIARAIVRRRKEKPIQTASELAELIRGCVPRGRGGWRIDPATRTFQALRIVVNHELESLEIGLERIPDCLCPGGRLVVISFHSLEDRRVKEAFRRDGRLKALTGKPVRPGVEETKRNPRARSAKLRAAERV